VTRAPRPGPQAPTRGAQAAQRRDDDRTARALRAIPPVEYGSPSDVVASVSLTEDDHPDEIPPEAR
jgi:hypothetical protein